MKLCNIIDSFETMKQDLQFEPTFDIINLFGFLLSHFHKNKKCKQNKNQGGVGFTKPKMVKIGGFQGF